MPVFSHMQKIRMSHGIAHIKEPCHEKKRHMHLSIFSPSGGAAGYPGEIRQFLEKSVSISLPMGKNLVSKIPWVRNRFCYIWLNLELLEKVSNFKTPV